MQEQSLETQKPIKVETAKIRTGRWYPNKEPIKVQYNIEDNNHQRKHYSFDSCGIYILPGITTPEDKSQYIQILYHLTPDGRVFKVTTINNDTDLNNIKLEITDVELVGKNGQIKTIEEQKKDIKPNISHTLIYTPVEPDINK